MKKQFCNVCRMALLSALVSAASLFVTPQPSLAQQKAKAAAFAPPTTEKEDGSRITINTELVSFT